MPWIDANLFCQTDEDSKRRTRVFMDMMQVQHGVSRKMSSPTITLEHVESELARIKADYERSIEALRNDKDLFLYERPEYEAAIDRLTRRHLAQIEILLQSFTPQDETT